ncbi:MAG: hemerythrin domain-containing protein [Deltaproteobacteria bacterium]|nr:hemerythrin domain-containing protein [Deltaproteobacteria bacterium]
MQATDELKKEHHGIELMLEILKAVSTKLEQGEQVQEDHLNGIMAFLSVFVDECHHGKEEEFLFPALEAVGVPRDGGPIGVMLNEHEQGRALVSRLKDALAGRKSEGASTGADIQVIVGEYVTLLSQHIAKENTILFPMADGRLDTRTDARLVESFERLERERIGLGRHDEFHALLHRLRDEYVN